MRRWLGRFSTWRFTARRCYFPLTGTDPALREEVVMLGAHLDSWHAAAGARPRRTIRVALWGGEEQGLLGSRAWLEPFRAHGARRNVLDRIGSTDHLSFTAVRVPAFTTLKDYADYDVRTHHTNADFAERVGERDLQQSAAVLAAFAYHAAMREGPLPRGGAVP